MNKATISLLSAVSLFSISMSAGDYPVSPPPGYSRYQKQATPPPSSLPAVPVYRVVEGKVYDATKSVLWRLLDGKALQAFTNGLIMQQYIIVRSISSAPVNYSQSVGAYSAGGGIAETRQPGKKIFVRNFPLSSFAGPGTPVRIKAMAIGSSLAPNGEGMELWDCGIAYVTPLAVPPPATNRVQMPATNAVSRAP